MTRALWKASLCLEDLELPVKLYAAAQDRGVHFRLLHEEDHVPVAQRMVSADSGAEVPREAVQRGVEVERGVFVVLTEEERAEVEPEGSRAIEITRFVPRDAIDLGWYRRPYWLGPDGRTEAYFALAQALADTGRHGVARWVMRRKRHVGALMGRDGYLALVSMRPTEEVVVADQLASPEGPPIRKSERQLAEQLVKALEGPFEAELLRDDYRERVLELVASKAEGRTVRYDEPPPPSAGADLGRALRESLKAARGRRVA